MGGGGRCGWGGCRGTLVLLDLATKATEAVAAQHSWDLAFSRGISMSFQALFGTIGLVDRLRRRAPRLKFLRELN
ncbi:unnamed protein product [Brugia timori]|uniref:Secreted protein n=1 Tax=Brugia timori TaxID=42155 RepID=A0A0R3QFY5_9BILA|nr:unnamed protein product [Brugia timori]